MKRPRHDGRCLAIDKRHGRAMRNARRDDRAAREAGGRRGGPRRRPIGYGTGIPAGLEREAGAVEISTDRSRGEPIEPGVRERVIAQPGTPAQASGSPGFEPAQSFAIQRRRFSRTAVAAASHRPLSDGDAPWTHVTSESAEQSRSAVLRWLLRWLGLGSGCRGGAEDRADVELRPEATAAARRCVPELPSAARRSPEVADAWSEIVPRRPGGRAPTRSGDPGNDGSPGRRRRVTDRPGE